MFLFIQAYPKQLPSGPKELTRFRHQQVCVFPSSPTNVSCFTDKSLYSPQSPFYSLTGLFSGQLFHLLHEATAYRDETCKLGSRLLCPTLPESWKGRKHPHCRTHKPNSLKVHSEVGRRRFAGFEARLILDLQRCLHRRVFRTAFRTYMYM